MRTHWDRLAGFFVGADVFLAYARSDAFDYVGRLAQRLSTMAIRPYVDQIGSPPDRDVPTSVLAAARRARVMVVVGSPATLRSKAVGREITSFPAQKRPLIVVAFEGDDIDAPDVAHVRTLFGGLPIGREPRANLQAGLPSDRVVERIALALGTHRQTLRLRRAGLGVAALLAVAVAILAGLTARLTSTTRSLQTAETQLTDTNSRRAEAEKQAAERQQRVVTLQKEIDAQVVKLEQLQQLSNHQARQVKAQTVATIDVWKIVEDAVGVIALRMNQGAVECSRDARTGDISMEGSLEVFYPFDSVSLVPTAQARLKSFADCYRRFMPSARIDIEGHEFRLVRSETGLAVAAPVPQTPEYALALSERRASSVRDFLVSLGIPSNRIQSVAYGIERPGYGGSQELLNSRAYIRIVPQ